MIIVPNIHCKKALQSKTNLPVLLLPHYIQSLVDQTPCLIATSSIVQYYLQELQPESLDACSQHINYILEHNLLSTLEKNQHPNTRWIVNITKSLLAKLKACNLLHPKNVYQYLIDKPLNLQYDSIQYYGFKNIPSSLQIFLNHHYITEFETPPLQPSESFYQFETISSEIDQAIHWLNANPDSAIVYLDPNYKEGLLRHQSLYTPLNHAISKEVTQSIPTLSLPSITYLYHKHQHPKGLSLLSYLSFKYYDASICIDYFSIHYPSQISQEDISYTVFFKIMQNILLDWKLEIPKSLLALYKCIW